MLAEDTLTQTTSPRSRWLIAIIVFLAALFPHILDLGRELAPDEAMLWRTSNEFALAIAERNWAGTNPRPYPGITVMWIETIAAAGEYAWQRWVGDGSVTWEEVVGVDTPIDLLGHKRLPLGLVHSLLVLLIWYWCDRLFGRWVGLLAGLMIAMDTFLLAEAWVVRMDGIAVDFTALAILMLIVYFVQNRLRYLLYAAIWTGLAILTKTPFIILLPFFGLTLAAYIGQQYYRRPIYAIRQIISLYLLWLVTVILTIFIIWPAMWVQPLKTLQETWAFAWLRADEGNTGDPNVFFWGQNYVNDPGWGFYPVVLAFRVGPLVLPGLFLLLLLAWQRWRNRRATPRQVWPAHTSISFAAIIGFSLLYLLMMSFGTLKYDRYLLPLFPGLNLLAAFGMWYGLSAVAAWLKPAQAHLLAGGAAIVLISWQGLITWQNHPYYYTYYNPLLGGIQQAQYVVRIGHGEGLAELADYLNLRPQVEQLKVVSAMSSKLGPHFKGQTIALDNVDGLWIQGDYVFIYISQAQREKHNPEILRYLARQEPEYRLFLNNFEYGQLYPGPAAQYHSGHKLEGRATLYGYDLSATTLQAGQTLTVTAYYRNEGQLPDDRFYARLVDADGYVWVETAIQPRPEFVAAAQTRKEIVEAVGALALPAGMISGDYFLKLGYDEAATGQPIGAFVLPPEGDKVTVEPTSAFAPQPLPQPATAVDLILGAELRLIGFDLTPPTITLDQVPWLTLYWLALANVQHDYVLALQLLDDQGAEVAYWLGRPARSSLPTNAWQQQQQVQDPWQLTLPPDLPAATYQLQLAVYDAETTDLVTTSPLAKLQIKPQPQ